MSPPVPEAGVWDPCVARAGSSWDFSPGRVDGRLLPVSPRGRASGCICVLSSSYKDQSPMTSGPKLVTSFYFLLLLLSRFSRVRLCATPQMAAYQAPSSLGFSRQEHWSELPFPSPVLERTWGCPKLTGGSTEKLLGCRLYVGRNLGGID